MRELGMDDAEIDAFLRAWDPALFALGSSTPEERSTEHTPPPAESFLYFLPAETCEEVSTIDFDPPPRTFRRAFAVLSPVPASGASH
jgi:hypothetical protein